MNKQYKKDLLTHSPVNLRGDELLEEQMKGIIMQQGKDFFAGKNI